MADTPQFYDNFALANLSLQERLGRSGASLNRDSAVFGQQARSFVQMLNYGLDAITARSASHLLNMDVLFSNDAYLLKLTEGILLNSIKSITPPKINASTPFKFYSTRAYTRWSSLGSISLKDGSRASLLVYKINTIGTGDDNIGTQYSALYCAGNYVQQTIDSGFDGYTPGTFAPIYVPETYKAIWDESVEVRLDLNTGSSVHLTLCWSLDELLGITDKSLAALVQNTPRGLTLTLGDGEIFGSGYNTSRGSASIKSVVVTYVKCSNLAPVDHATIKFNKDIAPMSVAGGTPLLSPMGLGDTVDTLRSRAVSEFFAASKITSPQDLQTEVMKIPFIRSCSARREYNWPLWTTVKRISDGYRSSEDNEDRRFYNRYVYQSTNSYTPGELVAYGPNIWMCLTPNYAGAPSTNNGWALFSSMASGASIGTMYASHYPSSCVYDNATIVLAGLIMKSRRYWSENSSYSSGDVVYHSGTKKLWLALRSGGEQVEPGSESTPIYGDTSGLQRYWVSKDEARVIADSTSQNYIDTKFDEYEPLTQSVFEAEIKGYFNIAGKLGFTSVVVEPLNQISVEVTCSYRAPYTVQQRIREYIESYVCYNVGKELRADELNAQLTSEFDLSSVYVTLRLVMDSALQDRSVAQLPAATYVPTSMLILDIQEHL